jgi:hypothetical protein
LVQVAAEVTSPAAPAPSSSPTKVRHSVVPPATGEFAVSTCVSPPDQVQPVAMVVLRACSAANDRTRSPAAVVVTGAAVVLVPPGAPEIDDEFWVSNDATPEYSHTVIAMSSDTDGAQVIVVSVPVENLYQVYAALLSTTDGPAIHVPDPVGAVTRASEFAETTSRLPAVGVAHPSVDPMESEAVTAPLPTRWTGATAMGQPLS